MIVKFDLLHCVDIEIRRNIKAAASSIIKIKFLSEVRCAHRLYFTLLHFLSVTNICSVFIVVVSNIRVYQKRNNAVLIVHGLQHARRLSPRFSPKLF